MVCSSMTSPKNIHEPSAAEKGTIKMKLLALLAPTLEVATKKNVVASDVVIVALKKRFPQKVQSLLANVSIVDPPPEKRYMRAVLIPYIQKLNAMDEP